MSTYLDYEAFFNGAWVPYREVMISPDDRGHDVEDFRTGVFEKCRTAGRRAGLPYGEAFKRVERV